MPENKQKSKKSSATTKTVPASKPKAKPMPKPMAKSAKKPVNKTAKKRSGGSATDSYGLFVPLKDIHNTNDLNFNKQFKYAEIDRVGKVVQSNFGI
jgi:hypothetical protein